MLLEELPPDCHAALLSILYIVGESAKMKKTTLFIAYAAVIAAMYATLTILQNVLLPGSASASVQFRVSEVLTILALYTPAAIPGLAVGCAVANLSSVAVAGPLDLIIGSAASLIAAVLMYATRNVRLFKLPVLAALMPALVNGVLVGFEIDFFIVNQGSFNFFDFLFQGGCVALGELAVLFLLGLPLTRLIELKGLDKKLFREVP